MSEVQVQEEKHVSPMVVASYDEVSSLIHGSADTILIGPAKDLGEEDPQQDLEAYVVFYNFDEETGKLESVQYQLPDKDEKGEETNQGGTGVIFGGHIDSTDSIECVEVVVGEDGVSHQKVTLEQFSVGLPSLALAMAKEVLNTDMDLSVKKEDVSVFSIPKQQGQVRGSLVVYAAVPVTKEQLTTLCESDKFDRANFNRVGLMGVSVADLVLSFNLEKAIHEFTEQLGQHHGMDPVSASITRFLVIQCVNQVVSAISYADLRATIIATRAKAGLAEATANANAAVEQEALADAAS